MINPLSLIKKICSLGIISLMPINQTALMASEVLLANQQSYKLEELKKSKINKKGDLVVKFCSGLKDFEGFVEINDKKFSINDADVIKSRKIVWT